jgi:hypothetical protein
LEKFVRYLNHNAYTVIAIESINFCPAAAVAWSAIWTHVVSVATINGIGDFILFLGKLAVAAICGFISLLMIRGREDVNFYIVPVIIITLFSFFIAHVVLTVYEVSFTCTLPLYLNKNNLTCRSSLIHCFCASMKIAQLMEIQVVGRKQIWPIC